MLSNDNRWHITMNLQLSIAEDLGYTFTRDSVILDFGCGDGGLVREYQKNGFRIYGCDIKLGKGTDSAPNTPGSLRLIEQNPYRIPFEDDTFDLVISNQVLEHVQDYPSALSEINRVLKPGGVSLHIFPSRLRLIEPHVNVPLASIFYPELWLNFWAHVGIRNPHQENLSAKEVASRNLEYLRGHTNYLSKAEIIKYLGAYFKDYVFCENVYLKYTEKGKKFQKFIKFMPFFYWFFSTFHRRVVFFVKDSPAGSQSL